MPAESTQRGVLEAKGRSYPYPLASACRRYLDTPPADLWHEWETLSRDVLGPVLSYLSHLMLSDLVSTGRQPAHLFHRIQAVLSRPLAGHYVGFLRETARYYRDEGLTCAIPELVDFLLASEVDCSLLPDGKALLGLLVDYRNTWAHGKFDNPEALEATVATIRELTVTLLGHLEFLTRYPLQLEDRTSLMGADPAGLPKDAMPLVVITAGDLPLRPLLLKLKGQDLVLLEDFDLDGRKLAYRGSSTYEKFTKKDLKKGDGAALFEALKALLAKVRAIDAVLPQPDWGSFSERASVQTERVLSLYEDMRKYVPAWYVPRPGWHGEGGVFETFLASDRTLLAISGEQGTGKSALVSHLVQEARNDGHAVLFINAQRFTFADVTWSGSPYPEYFAQLLHYERPIDKEALARIVKGAPSGKQVVLFIDAINEVDGITVKWNRFRAMELLLEWIVAIAQPGIKVVLSFRLDAYEDYEYLQDDEVPPELKDIAYPGTNLRKPWVTDLEPFDEAQAELLYEKLQAEPQHGMAPAMSWEEVKAGLGKHLNELTSNPLLFQIFLRSHHNEREVLIADKEELFTRYAEKLTGALERKDWPWWKKAWGFVKNGNITPKEQFLADVVSKMAEEGSAAFLVQRLNPKKKRDKRLLKVIHDEKDRALEDLEEGGLLVEEKIEILKEGQLVSTKRITLVAELLQVALHRTQHALRQRAAMISNLRSDAFVTGLFWFAIVSLVLMNKGPMVAQGRKLGLVPADAAVIYGRFFVDAVVFRMMPVATLILVMGALVPLQLRIFLKSRGLSRWSSDPHEAAFFAAFSRAANSTFAWIVFPATSLSFLSVVFLALFLPELPLFVIGAPLVILCVIVCSLVLVRPLYMRLLRACHVVGPMRVIRRSYALRSVALDASYAHEYGGRGLVPAVAGAVGVLVVAALVWRFDGQVAESVHALSYSELTRAKFFEIGYSILNTISTRQAPLFIAGVALVEFLLVGLFAPHVGKVLYARVLAHLQRGGSGLGNARTGLRWGVAVLGLVVACSLATVMPYAFLARRSQEVAATKLRALGAIVGFGRDGSPETADFGDVVLSAEALELLRDLRGLRTLSIKTCAGVKVAAGAFPYLRRFEGPCNCLDARGAGTSLSLVLSDCDVLPETLAGAARHLTLRGKVGDTEHLADYGVGLWTLSVPEDVAGRIAEALPSYSHDLLYGLEGPHPPSIDWVDEHLAEVLVLDLEQWPRPGAKGFGLLRRVWLPVDGTSPEALAAADQLSWLLFKVNGTVPSEWYARLYRVVREHLPSLRTLEFAAVGEDGQVDSSSVLSSRTPAGHAALLARLVADPTLIGWRTSRQPATSSGEPISPCRDSGLLSVMSAELPESCVGGPSCAVVRLGHGALDRASLALRRVREQLQLTNDEIVLPKLRQGLSVSRFEGLQGALPVGELWAEDLFDCRLPHPRVFAGLRAELLWAQRQAVRQTPGEGLEHVLLGDLWPVIEPGEGLRQA